VSIKILKEVLGSLDADTWSQFSFWSKWVSTVSFWLVFLCYLLYYNNLYYVKTSNIVLGLVRKIVVHFYTDFTSWLLTQMWLFPYPYGFCNTVWIHGMKINVMIWYDMLQPYCYIFTVTDFWSHHQAILSMQILVSITMWQPSIMRSTVDLLTWAWVERGEEISSTLRIKKRI
jgi:hypothetical protein